MSPYAEVIGDPIAHSLSPAIHGFWLCALGIDGDYRATRVRKGELGAHFPARRDDPDWRGCNVTAPHKEALFDLLDEIGAEAKRIGAVNCIHRRDGKLVGCNTDVDGLAEALAGAAVAGGRFAIIGAGGGARAAVQFAVTAKAGKIAIVARDPARAASLTSLGGARTEIRILPVERAGDAFAGAAAIVNATPMGMASADAMPGAVLAAFAASAPDAVAMDMVYAPLETEFLAAARAAGLATADGLSMLIGQARRAFHLFFGTQPPAVRDAELRALLVGQS
jgi:shikimate dehydrogenase